MTGVRRMRLGISGYVEPGTKKLVKAKTEIGFIPSQLFIETPAEFYVDEVFIDGVKASCVHEPNSMKIDTNGASLKTGREVAVSVKNNGTSRKDFTASLIGDRS